MPVTTGRKAIRFKSLDKMLAALDRDDEYQHRHLVLGYLSDLTTPATRRMVHENTGVPVNAIPRVVGHLMRDGAVEDAARIVCPYSGRKSRGIVYNHEFKGPY